ELRQALHPGTFTNWLDDQSVESKALRKIFKSSNPDYRMRDVELLLRYIGFHYFLSDYRGNLKEFLDMTCERLNNQRYHDNNQRYQDNNQRYQDNNQRYQDNNLRYQENNQRYQDN
ncbi:MAG: DUF262 domain-containing protein, partial [Dolichospermum sp.]